MAYPSRSWLLLPAGISLLAGLNAALLLADIPAPLTNHHLPSVHGIVMTFGFLGTLINVERAVALNRSWGYLAPLLLGLGGLAAVSPLPIVVAKIFFLTGFMASVAVTIVLWQRQRDAVLGVHILAVVCALSASILWLRLDAAQLLAYLVGFIVLTIAAERVELSRLSMPASSPKVLLVLAASLLAAAMLSLLFPFIGFRLLGAVLAIVTGWLLSYDIARRTIKISGLPRLSATALLAGYGWLAVAALTWLLVGPATTIRSYDTVIHAVFLGFAMSMVIAHAPIIMPAVLRRPLPYHSTMWLPLLVLHSGLVLRIAFGNGLQLTTMWRWGSGITVAALLLFVATAIGAILHTARKASP